MPENQKISAADIGVLSLGDRAKMDFHAPHTGARADRTIFCAGCQAQTKHVCSVDKNKELLATCDSCGRALKFQFPESTDHLVKMLDAHHKGNVGQVRIELAEAARKEIDSAFLKLMGVSDK